MKDKLQKAIDLSRRTGDRLIVYDMAEDNDPFVVMPVDQYERLAVKQNSVRGLSEEELTEKINRDIAIWRSEQDEVSEDFNSRAHAWRRPARRDDEDEEYGNGFSPIGDLLDETSIITDHLHVNRDRYLEEDFGAEDVFSSVKKPARRQWGIPEERKEAAEEIIEEDRQYLEEIRF